MAISLAPLTTFTQTVVAAGTAIAVSTDIPDNCHTIIFKNPSVANTIYIAVQVGVGAITAANGITLGPTQSFTWPIGILSERPTQFVTADLYFDASVAGAVCYVTYMNGIKG